MKKPRYPKWLKADSISVIGEFTNEHGELFVAYHMRGVAGNPIFLTGDELDWESGWCWNGETLVTMEMLLSNDEISQLKALAVTARGLKINNHMEDSDAAS